MIGEKSILALCAMVFSAQTSCVANNMSHSCSIEGAELLGDEASPEQICNAFKARLDEALAAGGVGGSGDFTIALTLDKRGTAQAQLSGAGKASGARYPLVAVDVMDRPLVRADMDELADEVARMLLTP